MMSQSCAVASIHHRLQLSDAQYHNARERLEKWARVCLLISSQLTRRTDRIYHEEYQSLTVRYTTSLEGKVMVSFAVRDVLINLALSQVLMY